MFITISKYSVCLMSQQFRTNSSKCFTLQRYN